MTARIAVIVASTGRPAELARWPGYLARQTLQPSLAVFSVVTEADFGADIASCGATVLTGTAGSCVQRNRALRRIGDQIDIVAIFDDDYVPSAHCLEGMARVFARRGDVVGVSGKLLADGINGPGIDYDTAAAMMVAHDRDWRREPIQFTPRFGLYGCNMAFRRAAGAGLFFDERLPRYGWQEDVDFARRLARHGKIGFTDAFVGVHQGIKRARSPGVHLGYSQIANPIYLVRKGTMSWPFAGRHMVRNVLANAGKSLAPEPWVDRRGRLKGNLLALADVMRGRLDPRRITQL